MGVQGSVASLVSHYFDADPDVPSAPRTVPLVLPDLAVDLTTDTGVFGHDAVDRGTRLLLLEGPPAPPRGDLLDLGCGYGPITVALATRAPQATVWGVDVNPRARALTAANAEAAGCTNVRVVAPDEVPAELRFAAIRSNPPIRIGKQALHELLLRWLRRLEPGGTAVLVVQKHLGADSLARWLRDEGHPTERVASRMGYRLLAVAAGPGPDGDEPEDVG
jgi:16S rRNA (guanine1207-N2)-methyltransferase